MKLTGITNNKLFTILTYDRDQPYQVGKNGVISISSQTIDGDDYRVIKYNIDDIVYTTYSNSENLDIFNPTLTNATGTRSTQNFRKFKNNTSLRRNEGNTEKYLAFNKKQVGSKFSTIKSSKELPSPRSGGKVLRVREQQNLSFLNFLGDTTFEVDAFSYDQFVDKKIIKEEKYIGLIDTPKVKSNIFMERDFIPVMERHQRMSDISNLEDLVTYNNEYFKMIKTA